MNTRKPPQQTVENLDAEIQKLETRLAELRLRRREQFGSPKDWKMGDSFSVRERNELTLDAIPDLVRSILDALPVSIFIKFADVKRGCGRRFTYINAKARSLMPNGGWDELEVRSKDDCEAFFGGLDSSEYQMMLAQETETLKGKKSREMWLTWATAADIARRRNIYEIPIFLEGTDKSNPIAFCAIAQEELPKLVPFIHSWVHRVFQHEYGSIYQRAAAYVERVQRNLKGKATIALTAEESWKLLEDAKQHLLVYRRQADALYRAFEVQSSGTTITIGEMKHEIEQIYRGPNKDEKGPDEVSIDVNPRDADIEIKMPNALKGAIMALVGNALRHTKPDALSAREVKITVSTTATQVKWLIKNRGKNDAGDLPLATYEEAATLKSANGGSAKITGTPLILGEILSRAFGHSNFKTMVRGPRNKDGWVETELVYDRRKGIKRYE